MLIFCYRSFHGMMRAETAVAGLMIINVTWGVSRSKEVVMYNEYISVLFLPVGRRVSEKAHVMILAGVKI